LAGKALELLQEHSKVRRLDTTLLFPSKTHPTNPVDLRVPWLAALEQASVEILDLESMATEPGTGKARPLPAHWDDTDALEQGRTETGSPTRSAEPWTNGEAMLPLCFRG